MNFLKNKTFLAIIAGFVLLVTVFVGLRRMRTVQADDELVVGVMSGYMPYAGINNQGELEGFDIDIANEIAKRLGKTIEFKDMSLAAFIIAVQQGKIDLLLSAYSITPETKQKMSLIYYQGDPVTAFPLIFWEKIPEGVTRIEDLAKLPNPIVCTEAGTKKERFLKEFPFLTVKSMSSIDKIIMDLKYGKSLAVCLDPEILPALKKRIPELVWFDVPVPEEYQSEGFGIGINKNNSALTQKVTDIIAELSRTGKLEQLEQRWFGDM